MQNIARRILIAPQHQPTMGAGMGALAQCFLHEFATGRTHFGGVFGVHQNHPSPSIDTPLAVREVDAVFEGFSHGFSVAHIY